MTVLRKRKIGKGVSDMVKKILILSGSPRKQGNSDLLCDEFMRGALEAGHTVEKIRVQEKKVACCTACYACRDTGNCAIKDDMAEIMEKMIACDVMVLSSPVYFYSIDAQLKAVIDRSVCRWTEVKNKEMYYIMTAADGEKESMATTLACFRGYVMAHLYTPASMQRAVKAGVKSLEYTTLMDDETGRVIKIGELLLCRDLRQSDLLQNSDIRKTSNWRNCHRHNAIR